MSDLSVMYSSKTDQWATPQSFFEELDAEFHFNLDPCADEENHKCAEYFTKQQDGLKQNWGGGAACSAIRYTVRQSESGLRNAIRKARRRIPLWYFLSQPERTRSIFTIIYCIVQRFALCGAG